MFRRLALSAILLALGLVASTVQAQYNPYQVPNPSQIPGPLQSRPYHAPPAPVIMPLYVPPPVRQYPNPQDYLPRSQTCFSTVRRGSTGYVVRQQCY